MRKLLLLNFLKGMEWITFVPRPNFNNRAKFSFDLRTDNYGNPVSI